MRALVALLILLAPTLARAQALFGTQAPAGSASQVTATGGTTPRTLADRAADVINAADFGAIFDGVTDDTTAIQAGINYLSGLTNGGVLRMPCKTAKISAALTIIASNVHLVGCGIGAPFDNVTGTHGGTVLKWSGAASGTMLKISPVANPTTGTLLYDSDATGILLDGNGTAAVGLSAASVRNGTWKVGVVNVTATGVLLDTANIPDAPSFQGNSLSLYVDVRSTAADAVTLQATGAAVSAGNVSLNNFPIVYAIVNTGWGLRLLNSDNNQFGIVDVYPTTGAAGHGVDFQGTGTYGVQDVLRYVNTNLGSILVETGYRWAEAHLDGGNGTPAPTIQTGASMNWTYLNGNYRSVTPNATTASPGAITADLSDGTIINWRGANAIDLQLIRPGANYVASGTGSAIIGYQNNQAPNTGCRVFGYEWNVCNGNFGVELGSFTSLGQQARAMKYGGEQINRQGDAQMGWQVLKGTTTSVTPLRLTEDGGAANTINCLNIPNNSTYGFSLQVVAQNTTTAGNRQVVTYKTGMLGRDANAASTTIALGAVETVSAGAVGTVAAPTADTTNGCVNVTWTAPNTDTWKVVAAFTDVDTGR